MADPAIRRVVRWLFGGEGTVVTDSGMQVVVAATAIAVTGVYAMSPILSVLTGQFEVTDAQIGAIITAFTAPSVVLVPVVGLLADRFGRRRVLVAGLLLFGTGGMAVALTTDFTTVLLLRAIQGVGFAAVNPLGVTIIGDHYRGGREVTAQGLRVAGVQSAALLTPPVAGLLVLGAWQYPFLLYGLAIPVAAWAWFVLPDSGPMNAETTFREYVRELGVLLGQPTLAAIQLSFVVRFTLAIGYYTYISVLMTQTVGASTVEVGLVVSGIGLVGLTMSTQAGRLVAGRDDLVVLVIGFLAVGGGIALMGSHPSYLAIGIGGGFLGLGLGVSAPIQKSMITRHAPAPLRAGAVSSALLFQSLGQAIGPLIVGFLISWGGVGPAFVTFGLVGGALLAALIGGAHLGRTRAGIQG